MAIIEAGLSKYEDPHFVEELRSDTFVRSRVDFLSERGFLPPINPNTPPTIESMRQTLDSQFVMARSVRGKDVTMVPEDWVDPNNIYATIFRGGVLEDGVVISVRIDEGRHDSRQFLKKSARTARVHMEKVAEQRGMGPAMTLLGHGRRR